MILFVYTNFSGSSLVSLFNGMSNFVGYLFNPWLGGKGGSYLSQGYLPESERNSATGVRTRILRFRSPSL